MCMHERMSKWFKYEAINTILFLHISSSIVLLYKQLINIFKHRITENGNEHATNDMECLCQTISVADFWNPLWVTMILNISHLIWRAKVSNFDIEIWDMIKILFVFSLTKTKLWHINQHSNFCSQFRNLWKLWLSSNSNRPYYTYNHNLLFVWNGRFFALSQLLFLLEYVKSSH